MSETESPKREHTWADVLCPCCGHMTYHRGHVGCIWPAKNRAAVDLALQTLETKSEEADKVETPTLIPGTALMATPDDGYGRYTNLDSTTRAQKRSLTHTTQAEIDAPTNTVGYVKATNARALCGFTDWRLPKKEELQGILASNGNPRIDTTWFPNSQSSYYWSSSPFEDVSLGHSGYAWFVSFSSSTYNPVFYGGRNTYSLVRLVR